MSFDSFVTTEQILAVFTDEILNRGGQVFEQIPFGNLLIARSIFPKVKNVGPGDGVQGGIALKAGEGGVLIYPYLFRQVCSNGAIVTEGLGSQASIELSDMAPEIVYQTIREKVGVFSAPEVFQTNAKNMRESRRMGFDQSHALLPQLAKIPRGASSWLNYRILREFFASNDQSPFALGNMITAVARDTRDPEIKWSLEELGGRILCQSYSPKRSGKKVVDLDRMRMEFSRKEQFLEGSWEETELFTR